jgi:hypothetical protein
VYVIIAYILQNRPLVDAYVSKRGAEADALRRELEQRFPNAGLRERLLARRSQMQSG